MIRGPSNRARPRNATSESEVSLGKMIYGPVLSRRFGLSLGVDLVARKHCTYDCLYCQVGPTTDKSTTRAEFVATDSVLREAEAALARGPAPDVVTLAGSGEPTLHAGLGTIARELRRITDAPLLLITNGSLLFREDVAADAALFDMVAPSLDAADPETFERINVPHPSLDLQSILYGLRSFSRCYRGALFLEVFLLAELNDSGPALERIVDAANSTRVDRVDLNTQSRPAGSAGGVPVARARLQEIASRFHGDVSISGTDAVARTRPATCAQTKRSSVEPQVLETLLRRPCTGPELASALGLQPPQVAEALASLERAGAIREVHRDGRTFITATGNMPCDPEPRSED